MAQFTNPFNTQNGMMSSQSGMPRRDGTQTVQNWDQQNWIPYTPEPLPQFVPVSGRWVENPNEIKPNEVPMDGGLYIFPQSDYQCIYAKVWTQDGRLMTYRFLPEKNEQRPQSQPSSDDLVKDTLNSFGSAIDQRLASFEQRINDILAPFTPQKEEKRTTKKTEQDRA